MFTTIRTAIRNKLETLVGEGKPLAFVYDIHTTKIDGYPSATFEPSDMESDFATTTENLRTYVFRIVIHQETEKVGKSKALEILAHAVDETIKLFDNDITLGGAVSFLNAVPSAWGEYSEGVGQVKHAEIVLRCNKIVSTN